MIASSRRPPVEDTGASLIIVLAFVTFVGLVCGAVLQYGGTSLKGTGITKDVTDLSYDADGSLKAAINQIRNSAYDNDDASDPCDLNGAGSGSTLTFPGSNTGTDLKVICTGGLGTGVDGGLVPINSSNRPGSALLTLGASGAETGLDVHAAGSGSALRIKGQVYVNSNAAVGSSGAVVVQDAKFHARTGCSGNITSEVPKDCTDSGTGAAWADPGYAAPDTSALSPQTAPATSCSGSTTTYRFSPGYYDDVDVLNNLTNASQCDGKTLWFRPGTYFFDFHNGEGGPLSDSDHEWTVKRDVKIVAGTPSDAWSDVNASPAIPGACVSPLASENNNGVQFVFGGDSRLSMTNGKMEVCGNYSADRPAISLYGMTSGADRTYTGKTAVGTSHATPTEPPGVQAFEDPADAYDIDGTDAGSADLDTTGPGSPPDTAGITLMGFVPANAVDAGSLLNAVTLEVAHRDYTAQKKVFGKKALSLDITPNRSGAASIWSTTFDATPTRTATDPFTTTTFTGADTAALLSALQDEAHTHGLNDGLKITFTAGIGNGKKATVYLDGIRLTLDWKAPGVRAQSGCVTTVPARTNKSSGGCYLVDIDGNRTVAYFQGTTYTPKAAINIKLNNLSQQVFRSGLVVRAVRVFVTGSFRFPGPVFEIPSDSLGPQPTDVYFRAYTCPSGATCSTDPATTVGNWKLVGTARASYDDGTNLGSPVPGSREVTLKSWRLRR